MKTIICVILDASGSMQTKRLDTIGGYNTFIEQQKKICGDEARFILVTFNNKVTVIHSGIDLEKVPEMDTEAYKPAGFTALYDAVWKGINIAKEQKQNDERVICVIMTDGAENSSKLKTKSDIKREIKQQSSLNDWSFVYIGENPKRWTEETSTSCSHAVQYSHSSSNENFYYASIACSSLRSTCSTSLTDLGFKFTNA